MPWNTPLPHVYAARRKHGEKCDCTDDIDDRDERGGSVKSRGKSLPGSRHSSLMAQTSSIPVKANAMFDQKLTVSQFQTAGCLPGEMGCLP